MIFTWMPFYKEFAEKLLQFQTDRKKLLKLIYNNRATLLADYLHDEGGKDELFTDIDPFTTFGIFNRGVKQENRIRSAELFKDLLNMSANVPEDFVGIPILNNQKSHFFGFRRDREDDDIDNLWSLFVKVVKKENFEDEYNIVIRQYIIRVNITMALFWIRPEDFLAFDSTNRAYLKEHYGVILPNKAPEYSEYMSILNEIKAKMKEGVIKEKTFYELSANANNGALDEEELTWYDDVVRIWERRKNVILYGAPGTGKTYDVPELAVRLCDSAFMATEPSREEIVNRYNELKIEKRIAFTTFHQSLDYEDWIEGLRPVLNENNQVTYEIESGIFKKLCEEAERPVVKDKKVGIDNVKSILEKYDTSSKMEENDKAYVMVIDELNRGNVSKVFGELITLLEADKRKGRINAESVVLPYSKKAFHIPNNVYLIATMNTADRSLGSLDYAIRRRFAFIAEKPFGLGVDGFDEELFELVSRLFVKNFDEYKESGWDLTMKLESADTLSEEYKPEDVWIGHSFFLMQDEEGEDNTSDRLLYEIIPLLEEYVRDGVLTAEAQDVIDELYKQASE